MISKTRAPLLPTLLFATFITSADENKSADNILQQAIGSINNISTAELQSLISVEPEIQLIDVRTPTEIATLGGTIDAGFHPLNINRGWLEFRIDVAVPDRTTPIVVFCGINQRSPLAAQTLMQLGYENVYNYTDGFFAWRDADLPVIQPDSAPGTMLYRKPVQVADGIWSAIGATAPPTYENSGHNNNLSFIITDDGVVVMNAGDNYLLAQALHNEIKQRTDQPVKYVVLENGQGHAMLGMNYWQQQGAIVIAHEDTQTEIEETGEDVLDRMKSRNRDKAMGTELSLPDELFSDRRVIELGGETIEILNLGPAHSPGDIVLWMPERKLVIAGDIAFHQRLLPVFEHTDTAAWIETWEAFAALGAQTVIPGHGDPTVMAEVEKYTLGYLQHMRQVIGTLLDEGGTLIDAYKVDQSAYRHLDTFTELAARNADQIYRAMEFE
ncbi:sulfurtransferase [Chromatiales bacterium (ex Bugula neritina AB1)]|nr:sulfurtransferase [Chromatiales bacterium (ex Bugula neritina AB1)]